jgi:DNA-binding MarR family transcriptional regulator
MGMAEPTGYRALTAVLRAHRVASSTVAAELNKVGLRLLDYQALKLLQVSEACTLPLGVMARRLDVHATTAAIAADRLEGAGLVRRRVHPDDRRATLVTITGRGTALADEATDALNPVDFGLSGLSAKELESLTKALERVCGPPG